MAENQTSFFNFNINTLHFCLGLDYFGSIKIFWTQSRSLLFREPLYFRYKCWSVLFHLGGIAPRAEVLQPVSCGPDSIVYHICKTDLMCNCSYTIFTSRLLAIFPDGLTENMSCQHTTHIHHS